MGYSLEASKRRLYKIYIYECRRKNNYWGLTLEQFSEITQMHCAYCGRPPYKKSRAYSYNGIDRVDPHRGYEPGNVIPACWECNRIKGNYLTFEEMQSVAKALREHRGGYGQGPVPKKSTGEKV